MTAYLVTGGAGFIGSHIAGTLLSQNHQVRILDNFSTGKRENLIGLEGRIEIIEGDLRDPICIHKAVQGIDIIFHQAAFVSNPLSLSDPKSCYDVNIGGTENLFEGARNSGVKRIVLASSAAVYGNSNESPVSEDRQLSPLTPYAASKLVTEILAGLYTRTFGLEVVTLRYFNVYGPRQSPFSQYAAAIPIFIESLLSNKQIHIFGDGSQTRDLIFVQDIVQANLIAAESSQAPGKVMNICTGIETSVQNLVDTLRKLIHGTREPIYDQPRTGDIYRSSGDPSLARKVMDFYPKTSLEQGLKETIEWMMHQ